MLVGAAKSIFFRVLLQPLATVVYITSMTTMWERVVAALRSHVYSRLLMQKVRPRTRSSFAPNSFNLRLVLACLLQAAHTAGTRLFLLRATSVNFVKSRGHLLFGMIQQKASKAPKSSARNRTVWSVRFLGRLALRFLQISSGFCIQPAPLLLQVGLAETFGNTICHSNSATRASSCSFVPPPLNLGP